MASETASVQAATGASAMVRAATELVDSASASGWRGSDPYDGLWWGWPRVLTGGRRRRQAIAQLHARSPVDIRRLYRRERSLIPKALAAFGAASLRLRRLAGDERFAGLARDALTQLDADRRAGDAAWGYPWSVQTRWSFYAGGSPNVVVTTFAARALAEGADALGELRFRERAARAALWTLDELYLPEHGYFAYHPGSDTLIHNASLLGARVVHELVAEPRAAEGAAGGPERARAAEAVARAVERTLAAQRPDGSWPYGEGMAFTDSFHTGFVLDCLCTLRGVDPAIDHALARGAAYYAERFFGA